VLMPLLTTNEPRLKKSSLTFINPCQKGESCGCTITWDKVLLLTYLLCNNSCHTPSWLISTTWDATVHTDYCWLELYMFECLYASRRAHGFKFQFRKYVGTTKTLKFNDFGFNLAKGAIFSRNVTKIFKKYFFSIRMQ
jgi:hypothetical protein